MRPEGGLRVRDRVTTKWGPGTVVDFIRDPDRVPGHGRPIPGEVWVVVEIDREPPGLGKRRLLAWPSGVKRLDEEG